MTRAADLAKLIAGGGTITVADNSTNITLKSTDDDANGGPVFDLTRDSASPADSDTMGTIRFRSDDDGGNETQFVDITGFAPDVSDGSEDGQLQIRTIVGGTLRNRLDLASGETVFNEDSVDVDFRVESNSDANMLFVDAGNNKIGIGTSSPATKLDVDGGANSDQATFSGTASRGLKISTFSVGAADEGVDFDAQASGSTQALTFSVGGAEKARLDGSGNFMMGRTSSSSATAGAQFSADGNNIVRDGQSALTVKRLSSDGDIVTFAKDSTSVGTIGKTNGQTDIYIGSGDVGLRFGDSIDQIIAYDPSSNNSRDDAIDLGRSNVRFDDIFATNGTIQTSDKNEKNTIVDSDLGIDFVNRLSPKSYKFNNKTRTHYGLIAQDVETVLGNIKKDASQFAGFCKDDISEKQDGSEYRYGLRYHEFISPMIQAIKDLKAEVDTLKAKVATLESK